MENISYAGENPRKTERLVLIIYSLYSISMILMTATHGWDSWTSFLLLIGLAASWIVYIGKTKDYVFRAWFTAIMMEMSIFLYSHEAGDMSGGLPIITAFVIFLGLYGILDIVYMTMGFAAFIFFYHGMLIHTISLETLEDMLIVAAQIGNISVVEYAVWLWVKRRNTTNAQMLGVIEELKTAERSKDKFMANVSHEIRTPINTICGMSELVLCEELEIPVKEKVRNIQTAGRNLMFIVSDILDFSELQAGKIELEEEAYDITTTINDVINMSLAKKNEKKIEIIIDCDTNIPCALYGDEKKLRRVIMNLVDNAIKFTEEGCVCISIGFRKEDYGINLLVSVKDTGIGIDEESLEEMFTSFHQVDASSKRAEGGLGLGLAISHAIVRKMGGAITIKSKPGRGTIVKFVVPQKILDETPIVSIDTKEDINVAIFIDMEQFDMMAIRDEYSNVITHMIEQLKRKCYVCRNFTELQIKQEKEIFTHIIVNLVGYLEYQQYFDELSQKTSVLVVLDPMEEEKITNSRLIKVYKPFFILNIASVLNRIEDNYLSTDISSREKFVTQDVHVLVVDDNLMNICVVEGILNHYNIKVTTAESGREALEKIVSANYDLVFMDHMMPGMDGVETMHRIRQKVGAYYQNVPIIALTANAVAGTREMMLKEGFTDFLEKPIERSVLERVLLRNLERNKIVVSKQEQNIPKNVIEEEPLSENPIIRSLAAEGLDVQKGITYCNGEEQYIYILQKYCENWTEAYELAQLFYEKEDWKNYTVVVHGMKSSLGSIGAATVSELARQLEIAGKEERIEYIRNNHLELLESYKTLFLRLAENQLLCPVKDTGVGSEVQRDVPLATLSDEQFDELLKEMENALYAFDEVRMLNILSEMQGYQYQGTSLANTVNKAIRKVEMSDYMSAVELMNRQRNNPINREK